MKQAFIVLMITITIINSGYTEGRFSNNNEIKQLTSARTYDQWVKKLNTEGEIRELALVGDTLWGISSDRIVRIDINNGSIIETFPNS